MTSSTHEGNGRRLATENGDEYDAFGRNSRRIVGSFHRAGRRKEIKQQFNSKNRQAWRRELGSELDAWNAEVEAAIEDGTYWDMPDTHETR